MTSMTWHIGHSIRVRVGLSSGRVMFRVKWHFGSGKLRFESINF